MYTKYDYPSKRRLKEDVKNFLALQQQDLDDGPCPERAARLVELRRRLTVWDPGPFNHKSQNVSVTLEGPHYPKPHKWYAEARTDDMGAVIQAK